MTDTNAIEAQLRSYTDPYLGDDLISAGAVTSIDVADGVAQVSIELGFAAAGYHELLKTELVRRIVKVDGITSAHVEVATRIAAHSVQRQLKPLAGVSNVVAVASAKGGVGKSTTAVNLALALAADGARTGLLDADIYGPSQPRMLGLRGARPASRDGKSLEPLAAHGIVCMSIGFLIDEDQPMVWRGPMVTQALSQLIGDTNWGELDYLIVDMPPGTGDTQLTLSQRVPLAGAVIVTTPQEIALLDARKGLEMFRKVEVNVLGVVENMASHICSQCGHNDPVFGAGGGQAMALQYDVPFLGALPLDIRIRERTDSGVPSVADDPDGDIAGAYFDIARRVGAQLARGGRDYSRLFPNIVVED